jgi:acetolactate synthase-1/3 small subunit
MSHQHILVALVQNKSGVLNRISSLFRRRQFNIDSLNVGRTENPDVSRMTIVVNGNNAEVEQVIKQLYKIINVLKVSNVTQDDTVIRETLLIKIHATKSNRAEVLQFANVFRAKAVDISPDALIFELTSRPAKVEAFIEAMQPFGIKEMVRTGVTVMNRGKSGEVKTKEKR